MARAVVAFFILLLTPALITRDHLHEAVIWNVGQGQWITFSFEDVCLHFDLGGESNPLPLVERMCKGLENHALLSHWDQDHLNFLNSAYRKLNLCLEQAPKGAPPSDRKRKAVESLLPCTSRSNEVQTFARQKLLSVSNDGYIYVVHNSWLLTADSPQKAEKQWINEQIEFLKIKFLILGHHGSQNSSSVQLLDKLKNTVTAIASQRKKRYGHPHVDVIRRLKARGLMPILTESFGHLHFRL